MKKFVISAFLLSIFITGNLWADDLSYEEDCDEEETECVSDEYQAGYDWAMELGATNEDACNQKSEDFKKGCLKGIENVMEDLRETLRDEFLENCTPEDCADDDYEPEDCDDYYMDDDRPLYPFAN